MNVNANVTISRTVTIEGKAYFVYGCDSHAFPISVSVTMKNGSLRNTTSQRLYDLAVAQAKAEVAAELVAQAKTLTPVFTEDERFAMDSTHCELRDAEGNVVAKARGDLKADACINAMHRMGLHIDTASDIVSDVLANEPAALAAEEEAILAAGKYAAIRLWGERLGSYDYYITATQRQAAAMNAPLDALYERGGEWVCVSDLAADHDFRKAYAKRLEKLGLDVAPAATISAVAVAEAAEAAAKVVIEAVLVIAPAHPGNELTVNAGRFVMTNARHHTHSLDIGSTDAKRLLAHWEGFNVVEIAGEVQAPVPAFEAPAALVAAVVADAKHKTRPATRKELRIVESYRVCVAGGLTERDAAEHATRSGMDMDYARLEALLNARAAA